MPTMWGSVDWLALPTVEAMGCKLKAFAGEGIKWMLAANRARLTIRTLVGRIIKIMCDLGVLWIVSSGVVKVCRAATGRRRS